jgi:chaperonin cofactor prefoldin
MAEETDLTIQILRQIQDKLGEHDRRFERLESRMDDRFERMQAQIDHRFDRVDREITELLDGTIKASGQASVSLVRHENVQRQFAEMEIELRELRVRLKAIEEKV